jgi:pyruvate/2-oxoglutarate/acetoin dehydrogenase E1 component
MREEVLDAHYFIRVGEALVRGAGKEVTLVSMGSMVPLAAGPRTLAKASTLRK